LICPNDDNKYNIYRTMNWALHYYLQQHCFHNNTT